MKFTINEQSTHNCKFISFLIYSCLPTPLKLDKTGSSNAPIFLTVDIPRNLVW